MVGQQYLLIFLLNLNLIAFKHCAMCKKKTIENNHGVKPMVFIDENEVRVTQNNLLKVIDRFSTEWSIMFSMRLSTSIPSGDDGLPTCNIINLSEDNIQSSHYGARTPYVGLRKDTRKIHTTSAINGNWNEIKELPPVIIDQTYHLEIHQRYVSNGHYRYFIMIDGVEVYSVLNTDARQFYNVHVYAGNPWNEPCPVYISNFKLTNFL
ncbi:uncharacterized protein [Clytia hemisphaerica]|uniref:Cnidarian restricted protein n=1 Tax=Clytia hemisphaerica TaxID=252671 RepID=A0A7M5XM83_9CNID